MPDDRRARLLTRIEELAPAGPPHERLCRASVSILSVNTAALILMSEAETGAIVAVSDRRAEEVEDLQFSLGEGPCLQAFHTGLAVLEPNLRGDVSARWPMFVESATAVGVQAVFALPLQLGAIRLGVLYLNRDEPGMLSPEELADAFVLAEMATVALLQRQAGAPAGELAAALDGAWAHRALVHQATGMVSAQLEIPLVEALARLRADAFGGDRSIYDVAAAVVAHETTLNS